MKKIWSLISFLCMIGYCADIAYAEEVSDVTADKTVTEITEQVTVKSDETIQSEAIFTCLPEITETIEITEQTLVQSEETTQNISVFTYPPEITDKYEIITEHIPVENIVVSNFKHEMYTGDKQNISATVLPMMATDTELSYSSSDNSVATVDALGEITAKNSGRCTIAVQTSEFINYLELIVKIKTTEIDVDKKFITLKPGETYQINASVKPSGADSFLTYRSSDENILSVNDSGLITAVSSGSGVVVISNSDLIASVNVIVNDEATGKNNSKDNNKDAHKGNSDKLSEKIFDTENVITLSDVEVITEDILGKLYGTEKQLIVKCDGYDIEIHGNDIVNIENEIDTDILFSYEKSGKEFTVNKNGDLPGKITIKLIDDPEKYRYVYMYQDDNNPRLLNAFISSGCIEIDSSGRYLLTEKKIPQYCISITAICVVSIILLVLSGVYIFVKKRYWFW